MYSYNYSILNDVSFCFLDSKINYTFQIDLRLVLDVGNLPALKKLNLGVVFSIVAAWV